MERFFIDIEKLNKEKALELYHKVCIQIIESNGLKEEAFNMTLKLCDHHIAIQQLEDKNRDVLLHIAPTWRNIKNAVKALSKTK